MQTPEERLAELYDKCRKLINEPIPCGGPRDVYFEALERKSKRALEMAKFLYEKELEDGCNSDMRG